MGKLNRSDLIAAMADGLREISGLGVLHSQALAARLGISGSDLECFDYVLMRGPMTAGELARATGLTTGAITGIVDRLERAALVRRKQDPSDRRKVVVEVPPAVQRRVTPLGEPMQKAMLTVLNKYDNDELQLLLDFVRSAREASLGAIATLKASPRIPNTRKVT